MPQTPCLILKLSCVPGTVPSLMGTVTQTLGTVAAQISAHEAAIKAAFAPVKDFGCGCCWGDANSQAHCRARVYW
jgi:hypothetical protein